MDKKLKIWNQFSSWEEAESTWNNEARELAKKNPLKTLPHMPSIPGMTEETAKHLKWKSLSYLIRHDTNKALPKNFWKHPLRYGFNILKSFLKKKSYIREDDFFFYGLKNLEEFKKKACAPNTLLVVGFSYCHKPFECPSGRFSSECIHEAKNPVCRQCFIGKAVHALPDTNVIPLFIPTIHYIGEKIFDIINENPNKKIVFLITACEMTLEMFGDWGNMVDIQGIGVRLDGRICNTMKAFELSEKGIKPGLTVVRAETQDKILELIRCYRTFHKTP